MKKKYAEMGTDWLVTQVGDLEDALRELRDGIEEIFADPSFKYMQEIAWVHGAEYSGPIITKQLDAAAKLLARLEEVRVSEESNE